MKLNIQNKLLLLSFVSINQSIQTEAMFGNIVSAVTEKIKENVTTVLSGIVLISFGIISYTLYDKLLNQYLFQEEI